MILKIKRERDAQDWWILDDIRKISTSVIKHRYRCDPFINGDYDIAILDNMVNDENNQTSSPGSAPLSEKFQYKKLICRTSKGDEFSVIFDTVSYLCNDEGKTIEKIVGR